MKKLDEFIDTIKNQDKKYIMPFWFCFNSDVLKMDPIIKYIEKKWKNMQYDKDIKFENLLGFRCSVNQLFLCFITQNGRKVKQINLCKLTQSDIIQITNYNHKDKFLNNVYVVINQRLLEDINTTLGEDNTRNLQLCNLIENTFYQNHDNVWVANQNNIFKLYLYDTQNNISCCIVDLIIKDNKIVITKTQYTNLNITQKEKKEFNIIINKIIEFQQEESEKIASNILSNYENNNYHKKFYKYKFINNFYEYNHLSLENKTIFYSLKNNYYLLTNKIVIEE